MPWVGSSSSRIATFEASHFARMTFCWLPPERERAIASGSAGRMSSLAISSRTIVSIAA